MYLYVLFFEIFSFLLVNSKRIHSSLAITRICTRTSPFPNTSFGDSGDYTNHHTHVFTDDPVNRSQKPAVTSLSHWPISHLLDNTILDPNLCTKLLVHHSNVLASPALRPLNSPTLLSAPPQHVQILHARIRQMRLPNPH